MNSGVEATDVVVVTGASRGIGLSVALRLAQDGFSVVAVSRTRSAELDELMAHQPVYHVPADLGDLDMIPELSRQIRQEFGDVYGLVNNAGIGLDGLLATQHRSDIDRTIDVNLKAPILLVKHLSRPMLRARRGRIVNVTSIVASTGFSGLSVYAATKAGLEGFSRSLAREVGRVGVTVNCVAPGFIQTDMTSELNSGQMATIKRRSPLGLATPENVADAVAFLLCDDASHITGTTVTVDGGSSA